jgi:hypothetical protein
MINELHSFTEECVDKRWYWGTAITAVFFVLLVAMDLPSMPPLQATYSLLLGEVAGSVTVAG